MGRNLANNRITWVANQTVIRLRRTKTGHDMEVKYAEKWWTVWLQPMGRKIKECKCMIKTRTILTPDQRVCEHFSLQLFLKSGIWNILKTTRGTLYQMLCRNQCKEKPSSPTQQRLCSYSANFWAFNSTNNNRKVLTTQLQKSINGD